METHKPTVILLMIRYDVRNVLEVQTNIQFRVSRCQTKTVLIQIQLSTKSWLLETHTDPLHAKFHVSLSSFQNSSMKTKLANLI